VVKDDVRQIMFCVLCSRGGYPRVFLSCMYSVCLRWLIVSIACIVITTYHVSIPLIFKPSKQLKPKKNHSPNPATSIISNLHIDQSSGFASNFPRTFPSTRHIN
jgi:hypothetical protein